MQVRKSGIRALVFVAATLAAIAAHATVTIETVPVGDPGNAAYDGGTPGVYASGNGRGAVAYVYLAGTYEVTAAQYCEFLNAIAASPGYNVYYTNMATDSGACGIVRSGSSGSYTYSVTSGNENLPVNNLTIGSAMRFCNWLHNGQPTGAQNTSTTEDGAYTLNGATSDAVLAAITRNAGAKYFLPTDDEWYKAAYYNGATQSYNIYPTNSSTKPGNAYPDTTGNNANYNAAAGYYTAPVSSYALTTSYYGAYDMAGNVAEFTEKQGTNTVEGGSGPTTSKLLLGGRYNSSSSGAALAINGNSLSWFAPSSIYVPYGFRVFAAAEEEGVVYADSCSYEDVSAAIEEAESGDTVIVPAGSATWDTCLTITKGIILKGSGIGQTVITTNNTNQFYGVIKYQPASPESNEPFRITGFTLNGNNKSKVIFLQNYSTTIINQVRIDHNRICNGIGKYIYISGTVYGVIDSNIIEGSEVAATGSYGMDGSSWANLARNFGDGNNIYFEDNVVTGNEYRHAAGQGGRYVVRFNTYSGATKNIPSVFEFHGNQPGGEPPDASGNASTMVVEIYGNLVDMTGYGSGNFIDARGAQSMIFFNKLINSVGSYMYVREEYPDDLWPVNDGSWIQHVTNTHYWANWKSGPSLLVPSVGSEIGPGAAINWQSAHDYGHSNIYHFRFNGDANGYSWKLWNPTNPYLTGSTEPNWGGCAIRDKIQDGNVYWLNLGSNYGPLTENVDFWTQKPGTFDGTGVTGGGVGCGPLANRPATCTPGVAYWATDQDCSNISNMVGAYPTTPITGTLYKCTEQDVWTAYYTPYTYPHPLRTSGPTAD